MTWKSCKISRPMSDSCWANRRMQKSKSRTNAEALRASDLLREQEHRANLLTFKKEVEKEIERLDADIDVKVDEYGMAKFSSGKKTIVVPLVNASNYITFLPNHAGKRKTWQAISDAKQYYEDFQFNIVGSPIPTTYSGHDISE